MLSPKPDEAIAWYRPVRYMRWFLSLDLWIAPANWSYTIYLAHMDLPTWIARKIFVTPFYLKRNPDLL
jgi:hypothetical protein